MKVLGISGSPRKRGNTEILLGEALASAQEAGASTELLTLHDKDIKPCDACDSCRKTSKCHIKDDMQGLYGKLLTADGIVFGTPVYFHSMSGQLKVFLDRTYCLQHPTRQLVNKVGGIITVSERTSQMITSTVFYLYFCSNRMLATDWVTGVAHARGAITKDEFAMKAAWELGTQVVARIGVGFKYPEEEPRSFAGLVPKKYGVSSSPFG